MGKDDVSVTRRMTVDGIKLSRYFLEERELSRDGN